MENLEKEKYISKEKPKNTELLPPEKINQGKDYKFYLQDYSKKVGKSIKQLIYERKWKGNKED